MGTIEEVGEADGWRCWLCDEAVDGERSVNDDQGPSVDSRLTKSKKANKKAKGLVEMPERLAHRQCNTGKGNTEPIVAWSDELFVVDPAPILTSSERLLNKGGREAMARCPTAEDAEQAAEWLLDRLSRLHPTAQFTTDIEFGAGNHVLVLRADRSR